MSAVEPIGAPIRRVGIPTLFAGVRFRSRQEAKWASFLSALKLRWDYEPCDLAGYIPDFVSELIIKGYLQLESFF